MRAIMLSIQRLQILTVYLSLPDSISNSVLHMKDLTLTKQNSNLFIISRSQTPGDGIAFAIPQPCKDVSCVLFT